MTIDDVVDKANLIKAIMADDVEESMKGSVKGPPRDYTYQPREFRLFGLVVWRWVGRVETTVSRMRRITR